MSKKKDLFDYFGQVEFGITLSAENTIEENAKLLAEHHAKNILPDHGFFMDFSHVPELKEPVFKYFIEMLGWTLDYDGSFLRKPEPVDELIIPTGRILIDVRQSGVLAASKDCFNISFLNIWN